MIRVAVHVHPGSSEKKAGGDYDGALIVRVTSRAVEGAATSEALSVLAAAFGVRPSAVHLVRGVRSRTKLVAIKGDDERLRQRLEILLLDS